MRLVVLGTGPFAVPMFQSLIDSQRHQVLALVTRPVAPGKARDRQPVNPMRQVADRRGLQVFSPATINSQEGQQLLRDLTPDLLVVCDYGEILSSEILSLPALGGINLHASLLPKYRGAAPIQWALLNGDSQTGVSVIHMTPRLDGGPILTTRTTPIGPDETHPQLEARLALLGIEPVHEAIQRLETWDRSSVVGAAQDPTQVTKAPRLKKEHGAVDWSRSAEQIRNQVRALKPWPGTYTFWRRPGHQPLRVVIDDCAVGQPKDEIAKTTGMVISADGEELIVATGEGTLSVRAVAPAGKRHMSVAEFLRGYRVREGDVLGAA